MQKNKTQIRTIASTTGITFIPYDDGYCHCDETCPKCGKRKKPKYPTIPTVTYTW